jgi:hypothetical protein
MLRAKFLTQPILSSRGLIRAETSSTNSANAATSPSINEKVSRSAVRPTSIYNLSSYPVSKKNLDSNDQFGRSLALYRNETPNSETQKERKKQ